MYIKDKMININIRNRSEFPIDVRISSVNVSIKQSIDNRIYSGYKLFNTNYIAFDMLYNTFKFTDKYTKEEYKHVEDVMHATLSRWKESLLPLMNLYLKVYSNPVVNKLSLE